MSRTNPFTNVCVNCCVHTIVQFSDSVSASLSTRTPCSFSVVPDLNKATFGVVTSLVGYVHLGLFIGVLSVCFKIASRFQITPKFENEKTMNYEYSYTPSSSGPPSASLPFDTSHSLDAGNKRPRPSPPLPLPPSSRPPFSGPQSHAGMVSPGPSHSPFSSPPNLSPSSSAAAALKKKKLSSGPPYSQLPTPGNSTPSAHIGPSTTSMSSGPIMFPSLGTAGMGMGGMGGMDMTSAGSTDPTKIKTKKKGKGGSSCHQCKSRRNFTALTYCTSNLDKKNKSCRKKFCEHCLKKFYKESPAGIPDKNNWRCPSCRKICCCAACRRRKQRETGTLPLPSSKGLQQKKSSGLDKSSRMGPPHGPHGLHTTHPSNHAQSHIGCGPHSLPPPHTHGGHPSMHMDSHNSHSFHPSHIHHPHPHGPGLHPPHSSYHNHHHGLPPPHHMSIVPPSHLGPGVKMDGSYNPLAPLLLNGEGAGRGMMGYHSPAFGAAGDTGDGDNSDSDSDSEDEDDDDDDDDDDESSSSYSGTPDEEQVAQRQLEHEQQLTMLFTFSQTPRVKKHIKYIKQRKDLTDPQKVEAIADLLRGGLENQL